MREYAIGVALLDLDQPERMLAALGEPLLVAEESEREGYVPNVVYSCGAMVHHGTVVLPYGCSDSSVRIAMVDPSHDPAPVRAALALAKLYQSAGRPADALAVLEPALEGFSSTPEMPEIAEARALLAELAKTEEVKAEANVRESAPPTIRRFHSPHDLIPRTHLLSNGRYTVMITAAGSGVSQL